MMLVVLLISIIIID